MENQVPEEVKILRSNLMSEVATRSKVEFLEKNTGKVRRTLILSSGKDSSSVRGLTDNGIDVILPAKSLEYRQNQFYDIPVNCSQ
jgi:2-methylthioadenine synthetase